MTNEEAKFTLRAYRPDGSDANDSMFASALVQARQDPALGAWFAREQQHAAAVSARLREIAPPPGLREAILAGARASGKAPGRAWWPRPAWMALAAAVAVLLGGAVLWRQRPAAQLERLTAFAVNDSRYAQHGSQGEAVSALNRLLSEPTTHLGGPLPVDFATLRSTGCRTLSFAGHDIVELCFIRGGSEFHFYVLQRTDFPRLPAADTAEFGEREGMAFASWVDASHRYVAISAAGLAAIKQLL